MARGTRLSGVDNQIKKKQERLFKLKEQSDAIAGEIEDLLKQKEEAQRAELLAAFDASARSYEEVIEFLKSAPKRSGNPSNTPRRGRRKKTDKTD